MFSTTIQPRFGDTDILGHINNIVPSLWFETARTPLFKLFVPDLNFSPATIPLIMAHTDYDFVGELLFQYPVEILTWVSRIGTKSFTVYHEARQRDKTGVKGNAVIVYYDFMTRQSIPIPEDKRKILEEHLL
jgi:acyl-CoA thioester hydrolase